LTNRAWVAGNETVSASVAVTVSNAGSNDPSLYGRWAGPYAWPLVSVHATLMPNGKVLLWDDHTDNSGVQVWDPATDTMSAPPYVDRALFCSGHVVLTDGRVLAIGGQLSTNVGVKEANLFDPARSRHPQSYRHRTPLVSQGDWKTRMSSCD